MLERKNSDSDQNTTVPTRINSYEIIPYIEQELFRNNPEYDRFMEASSAKVLTAYQDAKENHPECWNTNIQKPRVFISYAWAKKDDYPDEIWTSQFILRFATDLKRAGFDVLLDVISSRFGIDPTDFMNYINDTENKADFVILFGTKSLKAKETDCTHFTYCIRSEINQINHRLNADDKANLNRRVLPVILTGNMETSLPDHYEHHIDVETFNNDSSYFHVFCEIIETFFGIMNNPYKQDETAAGSTQELLHDERIINYRYLAKTPFYSELIDPENTQYQSLYHNLFRLTSNELQQNHSDIVENTTRQVEILIEEYNNLSNSTLDPNQTRDLRSLMSLRLEQSMHEFRPNSGYFIGRTDYLEEESTNSIRQILINNDIESGISICALTGLGGIGKTSLSIQYAETYCHNYQIIWFLRAENDENLRADFLKYGKILAHSHGISLPNNDDETIDIIKSKLGNMRSVLIIFDNVEPEHYPNFSFYFPNNNTHILLTSRNRQWSALGIRHQIELRELTLDEAVECLFNISEKDRENPQNIKDAENLAERLCRIPLALVTASHFVRPDQTNLSFREYLEYFEKYTKELLDSELNLFDYEHTVKTSLEISINRLKEQDPECFNFLCVLAFINPEAVSFNFANLWLKHIDSPLPEITSRIMIRSLNSTSLINRMEEDSDVFSIHRIVQNVVISLLSKNDNINTIIHIINFFSNFTADSSFMSLYYMHILKTLDFANQYCLYEHSDEDVSNKIIDLCGKYTSHFFDQGQYRSAIRFNEIQLIFLNHRNHSNSLDEAIAAAKIMLALSYYKEQNDEKAYELATELKDEFSLENDTWKIDYILSSVLNRRGEYSEAYNQISSHYSENEEDIEKNFLLTKHIGRIHYMNGNINGAELMFNRAKHIAENTPFFSKSRYGNILRALSKVYFRQCKYTAGLNLITQAHELHYEMHGELHPEVGRDTVWIANFHCRNHNYTLAKEFYEKTETLQSEIFGDDRHPYVTAAKHGLGIVEYEECHYQEALEIFTEVYEKRSEMNGDKPPTPRIARTLMRIGNCHLKLGDPLLAREYFERALHIFQDKYNNTHERTATALMCIGVTYLKEGELELAIKHLNKSIVMLKSVYNTLKHRDVVSVLYYMAEILLEKESYMPANQTAQLLLKIQSEIYENNHHQRIAYSYNLLARSFLAESKFTAAGNAISSSLAILEDIFEEESNMDLEEARSISDSAQNRHGLFSQEDNTLQTTALTDHIPNYEPQIESWYQELEEMFSSENTDFPNNFYEELTETFNRLPQEQSFSP